MTGKAEERVTWLQRLHVEWPRFLSISKGEFDETLIPDVLYITGSDVGQWRRNLALSGNPAVSAWADTMSQDTVGQQVLAHILSRLLDSKLNAQAKMTAPEA